MTALLQHAAFDSHPKSIVGTRAYIAPEIILSRFNRNQYNGEVCHGGLRTRAAFAASCMAVVTHSCVASALKGYAAPVPGCFLNECDAGSMRVFNLTCNFGDTTCSSCVLSAKGIWSREVGHGNALSAQAADVWSAGVMLYLMLVGAYPFEDRQDPANLSKTIQVRSTHYAHPSSHAHTVLTPANSLIPHQQSSHLDAVPVKPPYMGQQQAGR